MGKEEEVEVEEEGWILSQSSMQCRSYLICLTGAF